MDIPNDQSLVIKLNISWGHYQQSRVFNGPMLKDGRKGMKKNQSLSSNFALFHLWYFTRFWFLEVGYLSFCVFCIMKIWVMCSHCAREIYFIGGEEVILPINGKWNCKGEVFCLHFLCTMNQCENKIRGKWLGTNVSRYVLKFSTRLPFINYYGVVSL